jgi:hypothetical protein
LEWITENNPLEGLHLKSFQKSFLSSSHALGISILSFGVDDSLGALEVQPMGVAPEL